MNPAHLEPVTQAENIYRGLAVSAINRLKTRCKRGHEFTPENTRRTTYGGRQCRACEQLMRPRRAAQMRAYRAAKRERMAS